MGTSLWGGCTVAPDPGGVFRNLAVTRRVLRRVDHEVRLIADLGGETGIAVRAALPNMQLEEILQGILRSGVSRGNDGLQLPLLLRQRKRPVFLGLIDVAVEEACGGDYRVAVDAKPDVKRLARYEVCGS